MDVGDDSYDFTSSIDNALSAANQELVNLQENIDSLQKLKPDCDITDYVLSACSGVLCGIVDIFLVGKPGESPLGNITDKWFANRTKDFAKLCGWKGGNEKSAIGFLERKFKVPYDQRGAGDAGRIVSGMNPRNHHFKSLAHNPSIMGLFFSILDQFNDSSHFIGQDIFSETGDLTLISLEQADGNFELKGHNIPSKFFCAFANWFGHLISDVSGASGSVGRGSGIPSPLWTWINDIIAVKSSLNIKPSKFDESFYKLALHLFKHGYDFRFQTAQAIPVFLNGLTVRMIYMVRRMILYYKDDDTEREKSFKSMWDVCAPFNNASVKRMLTVAHGSFCLVDAADATIHGFMSGGGTFNPVEFLFRLNIVGVGRFAFSVFGEVKDAINYQQAKREAHLAYCQKPIVEDYIQGLKSLQAIYNDKDLFVFVAQLENSEAVRTAFQNSVKLANLRGVDAPLKTKSDIDKYFLN